MPVIRTPIKIEVETEIETIEQLKQVLSDLKEIKEVHPDIQIKIRVRLT